MPSIGLRHELALLARFASVGAGVTLLHLTLALALVRGLGWAGQAANLTAFCVAFCVAFVAHHRVTFRSARSYRAALVRFVCVGGLAYGASAALLYMLETYTALSPAWCVGLAASGIPVINYLAGRLWVF